MTSGRASGSRQPAAGGTQPSIEVRIEELVLHGFAPGDRYRIGEAVVLELGRLLAERGVPGRLTDGGDLEYLDGGAFEVTPGSRAEEIGGQIAQAICGGSR